ncbi:hypothetical protein LI291_10100 [Intestinibacillus massiliensis]|nr:hypothetical protein [Intestinibacillus massiliensis]
MRKFVSAFAAAILLACALSGAASAHGGHHAAPRQCSTSACMANGVCDGTCTGGGSCRDHDGCNAQHHTRQHGHGRHH